MKIRINLIFITTVLSFLFSTSAYSGATYTIGTEDLNYPPFGVVQSGKVTGFYKDLFDEFGKTKGYTFIFKATPVKRLLNNLITNQIDFKIPDSAIWGSSLKTGKNIVYSNKVTEYADGVFVTPVNENVAYENLSSLTTVRGFTPFIFLDDISKGAIKLNETTNLDTVIKMVVAGRAQGGFANVTVAQQYMTKQLKKPGLLVHAKNIPTATSDISLSTIKHPKVIAEFNAFLESHAQWVSDLKKKQNIP